MLRLILVGGRLCGILGVLWPCLMVLLHFGLVALRKGRDRGRRPVGNRQLVCLCRRLICIRTGLGICIICLFIFSQTCFTKYALAYSFLTQKKRASQVSYLPAAGAVGPQDKSAYRLRRGSGRYALCLSSRYCAVGTRVIRSRNRLLRCSLVPLLLAGLLRPLAAWVYVWRSRLVGRWRVRGVLLMPAVLTLSPYVSEYI